MNSNTVCCNCRAKEKMNVFIEPYPETGLPSAYESHITHIIINNLLLFPCLLIVTVLSVHLIDTRRPGIKITVKGNSLSLTQVPVPAECNTASTIVSCAFAAPTATSIKTINANTRFIASHQD